MAKTIDQLNALAATPDAADEFVISDNGVTKKITATNVAAAAWELAGNKALNDGSDIVLGTTTGSKIGTDALQKLAFFDATPVVQPAAAGQAAAAAQTQDTLTNNTGGTVSTTLAAITAGATYAQADLTAIKNALASIASQLGKIKTDVDNVKTLQNAMRSALVDLGLIKGAA
jgi:hypothetical protein